MPSFPFKVSEAVEERLLSGAAVSSKEELQNLLKEGYGDYIKVFSLTKGEFYPVRDGLLELYEKKGVEGLRAFAEEFYNGRKPTTTLLGTSFEGIINDGAVECFFSMALGAYAGGLLPKKGPLVGLLSSVPFLRILGGLLPTEGPLGDVAQWIAEKVSSVGTFDPKAYDKDSKESKAKVKELAKAVGEHVKSFIVSAQRIANSLSGDVELTEKEAKVRDVLLAFLALRPEVGVADDYMFVLRALQKMGWEKVKELARAYEAFRKGDSSAYTESAVAPFAEAFREEKAKVGGRDEEAFNAFYFARELMKGSSKEMWEQLNRPAPLFDALLAFSQVKVEGIPLVALSILSTKDEESIRQLCAAHVKKAAEKRPEMAFYLKAAEEKIGSEECFISNINGIKSIVEKGSVLGLDKKEAKGLKNVLQLFEKGENSLYLPPMGRWLRLDDRFDSELVRNLAMLNVPTIVGEGGYAYPWDYRNAGENTFVLDVSGRDHLLVDALAYHFLSSALVEYWKGDDTLWRRLQGA